MAPTSRLRNRGFNCEGGDCEELLLLFSFVIDTRDLFNVDLRHIDTWYLNNYTYIKFDIYLILQKSFLLNIYKFLLHFDVLLYKALFRNICF